MVPLVEKAVGFMVKNAPRILTSIGIGGVIATSVMAVKETPEAMAKIEELDIPEDAHPVEVYVEKAKAVLPVYLPAIGMGVLTITSILSAQRIMNGRQAAAAVAATIAENALKDYQDEVLAKVGANKALDIREGVAKKCLEKAPNVDESVVEHTGRGDVLCFDAVTGRYFRSSIEDVRKAESTIVKWCADEMSVSLNTFYEELGLRPCKFGQKIGWRIDGVRPDIHFSSHIKDDVPVLVIDYCVDDRLRY